MTKRFYAFNNMYIAGIANGIQADHAKDEIWLNVLGDPKAPVCDGLTKLGFMKDFAKFHKTTIILSAGDHDFLSDIYATLFLDKANPYPHGIFREPGLNHAITSIGIVIPERLYDDIAIAFGSALARHGDQWNLGIREADLFKAIHDRNFTKWEQDFLKFKAPCQLAK